MKKILIPTTIAVMTAPLISLVGCNKNQEVIPTAITLDKTTTTIKENETLQLNASIEPTNAEVELVWSSSDEKVATVSETGLVTGIKEGTTTITVKVVGYDNLTDTCDVTVEKDAIEVKLDNETGTFSMPFLCSDPFTIQVNKTYRAIIDIADDTTHSELYPDIVFAIGIDNATLTTAKFKITSFVVDGKTIAETQEQDPGKWFDEYAYMPQADSFIIGARLTKDLTNTSKIIIDLTFSTPEPTGKDVFFQFSNGA